MSSTTRMVLAAAVIVEFTIAVGCNAPAVPPPSDTQSSEDVEAIENDGQPGDTGPYQPFELQPIGAWGRERGRGGEGHGPEDFSYPSGIALSKDERELYVYDTGNQRIKVLDRNGQSLRTWPVPSCVVVGETIAVGLDGTVFVPDSGSHEIVGYSSIGEEVSRWRIEGVAPSCSSGAQYTNPLVVGPSGDIYVGDLQLGQIHQFTPVGDLVRTFGSRGEEKAQFALGPLGLVLANGLLYAPDVLVRFSPSQERFLLFNTGGDFQGYMATVPNDPFFDFATALAEHNGWVVAIRDSDPPSLYLKPPSAPTFGYRWKSEGRNPSLGDLNAPFAIAIAKDGLWYITELYNHRVQVMRPSITFE